MSIKLCYVYHVSFMGTTQDEYGVQSGNVAGSMRYVSTRAIATADSYTTLEDHIAEKHGISKPLTISSITPLGVVEVDTETGEEVLVRPHDEVVINFFNPN